MKYFCVLVHHRLPALCCAMLCTGALALSIGTAATCQFFKVEYGDGDSAGSYSGHYQNQHSPYEKNNDNVPIAEESQFIAPSFLERHYSYIDSSSSITGNKGFSFSYSDTTTSNTRSRTFGTHDDLGLFCSSSSAYSQSSHKDILWQIARGFQIVSLFCITFCTLAAWSSSIFKPTPRNWKTLSIISVSSAGIEIPVFLLWTCQVCQLNMNNVSGEYDDDVNILNSGIYGSDHRTCVVGKGFFMLLWSIILLCSVTVVTQMFNYPEYMDVLDEWRVRSVDGKEDERRNFLSIFERRDANEDVDDQECNEQLLEEGQVRNHNVYDDRNIDKDIGLASSLKALKHSPRKNFTDDLKSLFFGKNYMKHEIFQEDSDYKSQSDLIYQNEENSPEDKEHLHAIHKETIDMRLIDTKSDSSRLMLRGIGPNGKKIDDDRQSIYSFELNLDDYDISHEMEESDDGDDDLYEKLTGSLSTMPMCHETAPDQNQQNLLQYSLALSCEETNTEKNDRNQNDKEDRDIVQPAQFSPSNRAATGKHQPSSQDSQSITYKKTLLQNQIPIENTSYPTQQLRHESPSRSREDSEKISKIQPNEEEPATNSRNADFDQDEISLSENEDNTMDINNKNVQIININEQQQENDLRISDLNQAQRVLSQDEDNATDIHSASHGSQSSIILGKEKEEMLIFEYFSKAIEAGTFAAETSNNNEEDEPEPVYYSSSDSETSSISNSTSSQASTESMNEILGSKQSGSYSDGDLPQTSQYLKKKLRRLRRKAERKKSKKKLPKSSKSVCSRMSLMEMTIDEETDLDLELEEISGYDDTCKDSNYIPVSSMQTELENINNGRPPAMLTPHQKKFVNIISPSSVLRDSYSEDYCGQICKDKIQNGMIPREIPVVSPTTDDMYLSETDSVSRSARIARRKRIKSQSKKLRAAKKKLTSIYRANDSMENSYGSDEASC